MNEKTVPEEKILEFSADDKAVILKTAAELYHSMSWFHENVSKDRLTEETMKTALSLAEFRLSDLSKKTGYESRLHKQIEERYAEIRKLNVRIRELEQRLASGSDTATLGPKLRQLRDLIYAWYRKDGFGHTSKVLFEDWGNVSCEFSGLLSLKESHLDSDTPVTDKLTYTQWLQGLVDSGWDLYFGEGRHDVMLIDTPNNHARLKDLIRYRFPTADITDIHSHLSYKDGTVLIRDFRVLIRDMTEIDRSEAAA